MSKKINKKKNIIKSIIIIALLILILLTMTYFSYLQIKNSTPTTQIIETCEIDESEYEGNKVYTISPKDSEKTNSKTIIYFHGGAYMAEMTQQHWDFIKKLVLDTQTTIVIPTYPIAPKYCYTDTIKFSEAVYKDLVYKKGTENLIAMGDSAGGGLVLALDEKLSSENIPLPSSTILISPWLDVSMSNEKIDEVQKNDTDLTKEKLLAAGILYARGTDTKNYLVSPIYGDLSKIENVTILTGTYDILNPDVHLLEEKANNIKVDNQININDNNVAISNSLVDNDVNYSQDNSELKNISSKKRVTVKEYEKATHIWIINKNCDENLVEKGYSDLVNLILK